MTVVTRKKLQLNQLHQLQMENLPQPTVRRKKAQMTPQTTVMTKKKRKRSKFPLVIINLRFCYLFLLQGAILEFLGFGSNMVCRLRKSTSKSILPKSTFCTLPKVHL